MAILNIKPSKAERPTKVKAAAVNQTTKRLRAVMEAKLDLQSASVQHEQKELSETTKTDFKPKQTEKGRTPRFSRWWWIDAKGGAHTTLEWGSIKGDENLIEINGATQFDAGKGHDGLIAFFKMVHDATEAGELDANIKAASAKLPKPGKKGGKSAGGN